MKKRKTKKPRRPGRPCKFEVCCCKCKYLIEDMFKPEAHKAGEPCHCFTHKGWICMAPDENDHPRAFSGWYEHGECEQFEPRS